MVVVLHVVFVGGVCDGVLMRYLVLRVHIECGSGVLMVCIDGVGAYCVWYGSCKWR